MKMKKSLAIILVLVVVMLISACGKEVTLTIDDDGAKTEFTVKIPKTVDKILEEAGVVVGANDAVTPALEEKMQEATDIVIEREHTVKVTTASGEEKTVAVVGGTVAEALEAAGVKLEGKQITSLPLTTPLKSGLEVAVINQMNISIVCDGETKEETVSSATVADALELCGIELGEDDEVTPAVTEGVSDGMEIVIVRIKYEQVVETESIAFETVTSTDNSKSIGYEAVAQAGEYGEREVTYQIKYVDGEEVEKELVEEKVTKEPVTKKIVTGPYVVSKTNYPDCDGSGHGYYEIKYSNGQTVYEDY